MKSITSIQADIIFKALYYTARNENIEIPEQLTEIYEVLAEQNPKDTHAEHTIEVMETLSEFIKNSNDYSSYFTTEEGDNEQDDELKLVTCPVCGEKEIENGEDGLLEHYTVCDGEK